MNNTSTPAKITKATAFRNAHITKDLVLSVEKHQLTIERYMKLSQTINKWVPASKIIDDRVEFLYFPLAPVSVEELELFRKAKIPSFSHKESSSETSILPIPIPL